KPVKADAVENVDSTVQYMDSLTLYSILYTDQLMLKDYTEGRFSYEPEFVYKKERIRVVSRSRIQNNDIVYTIEIKNKDSNIAIDDFTFFNEDRYEYLNSKIKVGKAEVDITQLGFVNDSTFKKVFPAGLWHGSIEKSAVKYYKYHNIDYYLL